eukprot:SAG11_NODE_20_length_25330_cov_18.348143_11_plen_115_part_00
MKLEQVEQFEMLDGEGIGAKVDGVKIYVGNRRLAERLCWLEAGGTRPIDVEPTKWEDEASTVLWYGTETELRAVIAVADKVRDEAKDAMAKLKDSGIKVVMLTVSSAVKRNWTG